MRAVFKKLGAAAALGAVAMSVAATSAEARPYYHGGYGGYGRHYYHGGGGGAGLAVGAGILGLAAGAAIASNSYPRYGYGYRGDYGGYGGYAYDYPPPPPVYYEPRCRVVERYDPYYGGYVPVRSCY